MQQVQQWLGGDPDPQDQDEIRALIDRGAEAELQARFSGRLTFGTAGLRGPIRAGPHGMNTAVIRQSTAGLAEILLQEPEARQRGVVVGFDARHRSEAFALEVTAVLRAQG
ncbi:MAG: phosphoglucomutase, partial [Myxococcales bacterium]|nr:phosphoglucomutase [Myxococcales bacterium]